MEELYQYHQMTFDEYLAAKEEIKEKIQGMAADYICIGYRLRQIDETQAYRQDGYKTLAEFAKQEYGLSPSATSRFMDINRMFSMNGFSQELVPEFAGYGVSKLAEMLQLTEDDRGLVKAGTTVADIRELKRLERGELVEADIMIPEESVPEEPELTEEEKDIRNVLLAFFAEEENRLSNVWKNIDDPEKVAEIMAPSGNKTFRKGLYMLFLYGYGEGAALKLFKKPSRQMTWKELTETIRNLYLPYADGGNIWENCYGRNGEKPQKDLGLQEKSLATSQETEKTEEKPESPSQIRENEMEGQKSIEEYFDEAGDYKEPDEEKDGSPSQNGKNREPEERKTEAEEIPAETKKAAEQETENTGNRQQKSLATSQESEKPEWEEKAERAERTICLTREKEEIYWRENGVTLLHEAGDGVISGIDSLLSKSLAEGCRVEIIIREG